MHIACAALVLLLLASGCAHVGPDTQVPKPPSVAAQPATPKPVARPAAPATPQRAPASKPALAPKASVPSPKSSIKAATKAPALVALTPAVDPAMDLTMLESQLRATNAIGIFTKLTLKNQVDDLLDKFRDFYKGKVKPTMRDLRQSYDLLMMKVLTLLQDGDQKLASAIVSSREAIWGLLADPQKFATLQG